MILVGAGVGCSDEDGNTDPDPGDDNGAETMDGGGEPDPEPDGGKPDPEPEPDGGEPDPEPDAGSEAGATDCNDVVGGDAVEDACGVCGGDGSSCACISACDEVSAECGIIPGNQTCDEQPLDCNSTVCVGFDTCDAVTPYQCGCAAKTTCQDDECGAVDDGCGATIDCGNTCTGTDTCGGGGAANACGCTARTECGVDDCAASLDDGCGGELDCSGYSCIDASDSLGQLLGTYAVRVTLSGDVTEQVVRTTNYSLITIAPDGTNPPILTDISCATSSDGAGDASIPLGRAELIPDVSMTLEVNEGAGTWRRPRIPTAVGWRAGWPSFCPMPSGAPTDTGEPDARATGSRKPWLVSDSNPNGLCNCPAEEATARGWQSSDPAGQMDLLNNVGDVIGQTSSYFLPELTVQSGWDEATEGYKNGFKLPMQDPSQAWADVTDCRVVDDDQDEIPGVTIDGKVGGLMAQTAVASIASVAWEMTLDAGRYHTGNAADKPETDRSAVACEGSSILCNAAGGAAGFCVPEVNQVTFVPIDRRPAPEGGWTCQAVVDQADSLFAESAGVAVQVPIPELSACQGL